MWGRLGWSMKAALALEQASPVAIDGRCIAECSRPSLTGLALRAHRGLEFRPVMRLASNVGYGYPVLACG